MGLFSVNIFNRKKLMVDNDASSAAKAVTALKKTGIPYVMHTKRFRNHVPNIMRGGNFVDYGVSQQTMNPVDNLYTYTIWVPRRRLEEAKMAVHI